MGDDRVLVGQPGPHGRRGAGGAPSTSMGPPSSARRRGISVTASPVTSRPPLVVEENTTLGMSRQRRANSICTPCGARLLVGGRPVGAHRLPTVCAGAAPGPSPPSGRTTTGTARRSARSSRGRRRARRCSPPDSIPMSSIGKMPSSPNRAVLSGAPKCASITRRASIFVRTACSGSTGADDAAIATT